MYDQTRHDMLPQATHDEQARQNFVQSLKEHLAMHVSPGNKSVYTQRAKPRFEKEHHRAPQDRHEVRRVMKDEPYYQTWSALLRTSQEMMWESVASSVDRQLPNLTTRAKINGQRVGSLTLNPDLPIPSYHTAVDIHCMPGGYHSEDSADDIAAGAVYDRAVHVYAMGRMGPFNDDLGASLVVHLKQQYPNFRSRKILDMGCSVGHSTVPYVEAYPEAEVYAIDIGASMLRYAHARAEALGKRVHFSQQNAERTNFADASFDLIVSHILLHETSGAAIRNIMRECQRLLTPGGMMFHVEVPQYQGMDPYDAFILDWDTYNNNEPLWGAMHDLDLVELARQGGFAGEKVVQTMVPSAFKIARSRTQLFQGGDFGGGGQWFVFGATK